MNIAIIEDQKAQREALYQAIQDWLRANAPTGRVMAYQSAESFLFAWEEESFDLLLVDIQLPGESGIALVERLRAKGHETMVVFITGVKEFVFQGYKVNALDYLLKPVSIKDLYAVLEKAQARLARQSPRLLLELGGVLSEIAIETIHYIEVLGHTSTLFYNRPGNPPDVTLLEYSSRNSLQNWMNSLEEVAGPGVFISPHRSFIVHLGWVSRISRDELKMADGFIVPIARGRWQEVSKAWLAYRRGHSA